MENISHNAHIPEDARGMLERNKNRLDKILPISLDEFKKQCEDSNIGELYSALLRNSLSYLLDVYQLQEASKDNNRDIEGSREQIVNLDQSRTLAHNALQSEVTSIIRNLRKNGQDLRWATELLIGSVDGMVPRGKAAIFALKLSMEVLNASASELLK